MTESSYWRRRVSARGVSRRAFLRSAAVTGVGTAAFIAGCGGSSSSTPTPTAAAATSATTAPSAGAATSAATSAAAPATGTATGAGLFAVSQAKRGGTIYDPGLDPTVGWDPHGSISYLVDYVTEPMHLKLIRHDYRTTPPFYAGNEDLIIGELAEKWESPDPLTYTFTLRKGINWPNQEPMNGGAVTSADVKYAFDTGKQPTSQVQEYVFGNIASVNVVDDYTVTIKLNRPDWRFPIDLDSYNTEIVPKGVYEWAGGSIKDPDKARGGGPWMLDSYAPASVIRWKPNEAYRKFFGIPYADHLNINILKTGAPQMQAFIGKQIQFFSPLAGELDPVKSARPDAKLVTDFYAPTNTNALFMKTTEKPFDDVRVRRAMSMAVDRDGWGKILQFNYKWESGPVTWAFKDWKLDPANLPADTAAYLKYNPTEAKKLTDAAGVSASNKYTMHMYAYNPDYNSEAQLLIDSLAKIGITAELKSYEYNNWISTAYIGKYTGMLYGPDNLDRLSEMFEDRLLKGSSRNHSDVSDDATQKLLNDFWAAPGAQEAKSISDQIQTRSVDQAFAVYRPQPTTPHFWDAKIQNYEGELAFYYQNQYRDAYLWLA